MSGLSTNAYLPGRSESPVCRSPARERSQAAPSLIGMAGNAAARTPRPRPVGRKTAREVRSAGLGLPASWGAMGTVERERPVQAATPAPAHPSWSSVRKRPRSLVDRRTVNRTATPESGSSRIATTSSAAVVVIGFGRLKFGPSHVDATRMPMPEFRLPCGQGGPLAKARILAPLDHLRVNSDGPRCAQSKKV
jgi:hypothetical protein